ncbi:MAG: ATP-binding protein [Prevotella sp.]
MRYLNKIVFINSAHVPYAEIKLDGNVHFIGTQGVGKSTLLRAILFFYNADKAHLGIRTLDGQKGFDDFYLPYPNSYIIYEICRETGTFFIMVFRSAGRAAFRIVDCAYERRFFIVDSVVDGVKRGEARDEWGAISAEIGSKVFKSNIIRANEEFRDIIYGNRQAVDRTLWRFSLLESNRYQNVPRTIQNIFLNQSLDSEFIKKTIIDSMNFANDSFNLRFFNDKLKNFRQEYEDIWKWYRKDKDGRIKVRDDADKVLRQYSLYADNVRNIDRYSAFLLYAMKRDRERLPQMEQQGLELKASLDRQRRLLGEENKKHDNERNHLSQEEGVLKNKLEQTRKKRNEYQQMNIDNIIGEMEKEEEYKSEKEKWETQEKELTDKNRDVKQKYDKLRHDEEQNFRDFALGKKELKMKEDEACRTLTDRYQQEQREEEGRLRNKQAENEETLQHQRDELLQRQSQLQVEEQRAATSNPFQEEMEEKEELLREIDKNTQQLKEQKAQIEKEEYKIRSDAELKAKDLERECDADLQRIDYKMKEAEERQKHHRQLIDRQQGSLIEWLGKNVENWEKGIGKVLDEESVLYNTQLNPRKETDNNTVFGVHLDVDNIDRDLLTPAKLQEACKKDEEEIGQLKAQRKQRMEQWERDRQESERKPNNRLKDLKMQRMDVETQLNTLPTKRQKAERALRELQDRLKKRRQEMIAEIRIQIGEVAAQLTKIDKDRDQNKKKCNDELASLKRKTDKMVKQAKEETEEKKRSLDILVDKKRKETEAQVTKLLSMMDNELRGLGVDMKQLEEVRRQLQQIRQKLQYIENHRRNYFDWQRDKEELFDQENANKNRLEQVLDKQRTIDQKFMERKRKLDDSINMLDEQLKKLGDEAERIKQGLSRVEGYLQSESKPEHIDKLKPKQTREDLQQLYENLRNEESMRQRHSQDFRDAARGFLSHFSPTNIFHFQTRLDTSEDFENFAVNLNDFMVNNKIELFRERTSGQFATVVLRIASEMGELSRHGADIKSTINDINKDFRENNFVGVIKDIELRAVDSTDRMVVMLKSIEKFANEHSNDLGESPNLFTTEGEREKLNQQAVSKLLTFIDLMQEDPLRQEVTLADSFKLEFKVRENDNDTNWVEKLSNVGSDGTDVLVKAMVNIMLINVFKQKISRKFGDFKLHCMMDEIGRLHPNNVEGILKFANVRNIFLINSSPTAYNASAYRYTYSLRKNERNETIVRPLLTIK